MLDRTTTLTLTFAVLALFAWIGVRGAARFGVSERDPYLTARRSQGTNTTALSFFASALGAWILFAPPEVGTFGGLLGIGGYALGQALAVAVFAWLGPAVRARVPEGTTILEFVRLRFGRPMQAYAGAISVLYMFVFLTAELTAIGGVTALLGGVGRLVPVVAVAAVTAAYTAYGGLPASLRTDRWQAWLIMGLVAAGAVAVLTRVTEPIAALRAGGIAQPTRTGAEVAVVLVIAIVAANLFHQGFWQRVWAARDRQALVRGTTIGGGLAFVLVAAMGAAGALAAGAGVVEEPSLAFFSLLPGLPAMVLVLVMALAIALVASTADTLQNGLTSLVAVHVWGGRLKLSVARVVTILLTVPAAVIALQGHSVLRLFLVADLLAATIAIPVFLGLWRRATPSSALWGSVAGVLGVVAVGWVTSGSLREGALLLTLPQGPSLGAFVAAPVASGLVAVALCLLSGREEAAAAWVREDRG